MLTPSKAQALTPRSYPFILLLFQFCSGCLASVLVSEQTPICWSITIGKSQKISPKKKKIPHHRVFLHQRVDYIIFLLGARKLAYSCISHLKKKKKKNPKFWSQPKTSIPKLTIKSPNPLQPQREKRDRKPYCHQPRSSIFALPRDGDPPPSVPASHHDYHYTHSQAPVAATHHEHLPSLPCAAMTFTCSLPFHHKYPIDPISKVTQYSPLCVIHFL